MSTQIILRVLALRHRLRQRDWWTRPQLEAHQARELRLLRGYAYARSPFYGRFHKGFSERPLHDLPIVTKETVMEHFDELVTDRALRLADVEAHPATLSGGDELFDGRYRVASTSGSTGRRGLFLWDPGEWAAILASYNRSFDWAGVGAGITRRTRMAVVSSTTPWHQSARVGASVHSPWVPTLRIDSGDPLESIVERLNVFRPGFAPAGAPPSPARRAPSCPGRGRPRPRAPARRSRPRGRRARVSGRRPPQGSRLRER
jgi:phenylacetate-CoA ligase